MKIRHAKIAMTPTLAVLILTLAVITTGAPDDEYRVTRQVISGGFVAGTCTEYASTGTIGEAVVGVNGFALAPVWSANDYCLFQDNFPFDHTLTGMVRMDMAKDVRPFGDPVIQPGDSATVGVAAQHGLLQGFWPYPGTPHHEGGIGIDPVFGRAAVYIHVRSTGGQTGSALTDDPVRWPEVDTQGEWTRILMDSVFSDPDHSVPVPDEYCVDLNDNLFAPPDRIDFYFSAVDSGGQTRYWSQRTGVTVDESAARTKPMEAQCLPTSSSPILYVNHVDGDEARVYFDMAFEQMGITPDRYDVRGASSSVGNGLGSRANLDQILGAYEAIIWNTGNLPAGTIGDGTGNPDKSPDAQLLASYLDVSPARAGLYISGDNVAEELVILDAPALRDYIRYDLINGDHKNAGHETSPLVVASGSVFSGDAFFVSGDAVEDKSFDVIQPTGTAEAQMFYEPDPGHSAIVSQQTANSVGGIARVMLSGFSYHSIRDDVPQTPSDRADHLYDVLTWLEQIVPPPTDADELVAYVNNLAQNYPNPFNPVTTIAFSLEEKGWVSVRVYNVAGQLVRTLVDEERPSGRYSDVRWDGRSDRGDAVASGVYFYKMVTTGFAQTRKMVLLK